MLNRLLLLEQSNLDQQCLLSLNCPNTFYFLGLLTCKIQQLGIRIQYLPAVYTFLQNTGLACTKNIVLASKIQYLAIILTYRIQYLLVGYSTYLQNIAFTCRIQCLHTEYSAYQSAEKYSLVQKQYLPREYSTYQQNIVLSIRIYNIKIQQNIVLTCRIYNSIYLQNIVLYEHGPVLDISLKMTHDMFLLSWIFNHNMADTQTQQHKMRQHPAQYQSSR